MLPILLPKPLTSRTAHRWHQPPRDEAPARRERRCSSSPQFPHAPDHRLRHTVTVIPGPHFIVIQVVSTPANPGVTLSDWIRWIGVGVALAGIALATPDGIAAAWLWLRSGLRKASTRIKRWIGRPERIVVSGHVTSPSIGFAGQGYVDTWEPWAEEATATEKLDILRQQSEELSHRIDNLRTQADRDRSSTQKGIREAESRLAARIRQVGLELSGERSQTSHVDARGLLPVGLGIVLTGLPDELAKVPAVGGLLVAAAAISIVCVFRGWLQDLQLALKTIGIEGAPDLGTPDLLLTGAR